MNSNWRQSVTQQKSVGDVLVNAAIFSLTSFAPYLLLIFSLAKFYLAKRSEQSDSSQPSFPSPTSLVQPYNIPQMKKPSLAPDRTLGIRAKKIKDRQKIAFTFSLQVGTKFESISFEGK